MFLVDHNNTERFRGSDLPLSRQRNYINDRSVFRKFFLKRIIHACNNTASISAYCYHSRIVEICGVVCRCSE